MSGLGLYISFVLAVLATTSAVRMHLLPGGAVEVECNKEMWPKVEGCRFRCPDHSCVKITAKCVDSFEDCECETWYKK